MKREQLEEYKRVGQYVRSGMYLRKSRAEENMSRAETLEKHRAALLSYAERYGFLVRDEDIYEEVVSGESLFARPQMLRLMEAVNAGKYEAVLCMDMQRLGRGGMYDQGMILDTFKFSETLIVTPERIYDLAKELDEQAAEMETFLSRGEYRLIRKRLRRGLMQSIERGAYASNPPFGYRQVKVGRLPSLEIIPEEAECVRMIFRMYAEGAGCSRIQQAVSAMGYRGKRGACFNRNTIRNVLDNPVYIGKIRWNHTKTVKQGVGQERETKVVPAPQEEWMLFDGVHPPIIDQELWDTVQSIRKDRYIPSQRRSGHIASQLAGLVHCSKCGSLMNRMGDSKGTPYLLCPTKGCCASAKFEFVEQAVLRQLEVMASDLEVEVQRAVSPDNTALQKSLTLMQDRLRKLEDRRTRLYGLLEDGVYTRALFSERMSALAKEEAQTQAAISAAEEELRHDPLKNKACQLERLRTVLDHYRDSPISAQKQLLYSIIEDIQYTKEKKTKPADFSLSIQLRNFF